MLTFFTADTQRDAFNLRQPRVPGVWSASRKLSGKSIQKQSNFRVVRHPSASGKRPASHSGRSAHVGNPCASVQSLPYPCIAGNSRTVREPAKPARRQVRCYFEVRSGIHAGVASSNWFSVNWRTSEPSERITKISPSGWPLYGCRIISSL